MAIEDFDRLIDGICKIKNIARTKEQGDACHLRVDGVPFSLLPCGTRGDVEHVMFICDFGPLPQASRTELLQGLMETNLFLFGAEAPRFGCNPETGHVLYMGYLPLAEVTPESVQRLLDETSEQAQAWRAFHLQMTQTQPAARHPSPFARTPPRHAALGR